MAATTRIKKGHWLKSRNIYFIQAPHLIKDDTGTVIRCEYPPLRRHFYEHSSKGNSIFAAEKLPKNAYIPYGGRKDVLSDEEETNIYKNNLAKYGSESRIFYWARYPTGNSTHVIVDAHPRHARAAGYPEDCCWPGSQINTALEGEEDKINCELVYLEREHGYDIPVYPYIHHLVFARTTRVVEEGEELLTRYGWSKNAMTRIFGPLILKPSGRRKTRRQDETPVGEVVVAESHLLVIFT